MRFGGGAWWLRLALPAGLAILTTGTAWGQPGSQGDAAPPPTSSTAAAAADTNPTAAGQGQGQGQAQPPAPPASPADGSSLSRLMNGPSLRETGRMAVAPAPTPMNPIETDATPSTPPKEKSIARAASSIDTAPVARPVGVIDARVLDREVADHFQQIASCRVEVARAKQVMPAQIIADRLLLRWIIEPDGSTASTDVVAIMPVDLGIMDCAKRVMSQWRFTRPRGGPLTVERPFTFQ